MKTENFFHRARASTSLFIVAVCVALLMAGCAGKNGNFSLSPKEKVYYVKIDRSGGPAMERIQRQCVLEVSKKRVARGGGPVEIQEGTSLMESNRIGVGGAGLGLATAALGPLTGLLAIPAMMHHSEKEAEDRWFNEEYMSCLNQKMSTQQHYNGHVTKW